MTGAVHADAAESAGELQQRRSEASALLSQLQRTALLLQHQQPGSGNSSSSALKALAELLALKYDVLCDASEVRAELCGRQHMRALDLAAAAVTSLPAIMHGSSGA